MYCSHVDKTFSSTPHCLSGVVLSWPGQKSFLGSRSGILVCQGSLMLCWYVRLYHCSLVYIGIYWYILVYIGIYCLSGVVLSWPGQKAFLGSRSGILVCQGSLILSWYVCLYHCTLVYSKVHCSVIQANKRSTAIVVCPLLVALYFVIYQVALRCDTGK